MLQEEYQWKCARAIARGICRYIGQQYIESVTEKDWREAQGLNALYDLQKKGIIDSLEFWEGIMLEGMPTWAVLTLVNRL